MGSKGHMGNYNIINKRGTMGSKGHMGNLITSACELIDLEHLIAQNAEYGLYCIA